MKHRRWVWGNRINSSSENRLFWEWAVVELMFQLLRQDGNDYETQYVWLRMESTERKMRKAETQNIICPRIRNIPIQRSRDWLIFHLLRRGFCHTYCIIEAYKYVINENNLWSFNGKSKDVWMKQTNTKINIKRVMWKTVNIQYYSFTAQLELQKEVLTWTRQMQNTSPTYILVHFSSLFFFCINLWSVNLGCLPDAHQAVPSPPSSAENWEKINKKDNILR